ncbi:MAG: hypothetical protein JWM41_466 [Gemmatimonadetes bacterium]|nr:hypothetical protein [Gemmatimonadota bacterium]
MNGHTERAHHARLQKRYCLAKRVTLNEATACFNQFLWA